ncbi:MAG: symmetrical bis(5'-nucleosyl)-tetraphosphatase [Gammaproteobacteria bacterium]|nr:symmetrical bis(5'-nucleosyl)-tetraphosphatase [Gammaproteobacteria bacterium]
MAIYAIGDVQGCLEPLRRLVDHINFDPSQDQLWFAGDLVNRGPDSLGALRFIKTLCDQGQGTVILGNHDVRLITTSLLGRKKANKILGGKVDTLGPILDAPDRDQLVTWLRNQPLAHYDEPLNTLMIHAGLPPQWNLKRTLSCADEVQKQLRGDKHLKFIKRLYVNRPTKWRKRLRGMKRSRFITNAFTRTRFCEENGTLNFLEKGAPGSQPKKLVPWFAHPKRKTQDVRIVFGHWASLGVHQSHNVIGLDSGCVWGGSLTAVRLNKSLKFYSVPARLD